MAYDYALRLANGRANANPLITAAIQKLTGASTFSFVGCDLANVTICPALESGVASVIVLYNSQSQPSTSNIRLPVGLPSGVASYAVYDSAAAPAVAQITPLTPVDSALRTEYYGYKSATPVSWLHFFASIPAMGYAAYFIVPQASRAAAPLTHLTKPVPVLIGARDAADATVTNGIVTLTFDGSTGLLKGYTNAANGVTAPLTQNWVSLLALVLGGCRCTTVEALARRMMGRPRVRVFVESPKMHVSLGYRLCDNKRGNRGASCSPKHKQIQATHFLRLVL